MLFHGSDLLLQVLTKSMRGAAAVAGEPPYRGPDPWAYSRIDDEAAGLEAILFVDEAAHRRHGKVELVGDNFDRAKRDSVDARDVCDRVGFHVYSVCAVLACEHYFLFMSRNRARAYKGTDASGI